MGRRSTGHSYSFDQLPPRAVRMLPQIGAMAYAALGVLAHHADASGRCWPGIERIKGMMGIRSERTVHTALARLEEAGLIERRRRPGRPTEYRLIFTPAADCGTAADCAPQQIAVPQLDAVTPAADCGTPPQLDAGEPDTRTRLKEPDSSPRHHPKTDTGGDRPPDDAEGGEGAYVEEVLREYTALPMTPARATPADRRTAAEWAREGVALATVRGGLVLAASRLEVSDQPRGSPVRSLQYFRGAVDEAAELDPEYIAHLHQRREVAAMETTP